jgi:hypothetical protein
MSAGGLLRRRECMALVECRQLPWKLLAARAHRQLPTTSSPCAAQALRVHADALAARPPARSVYDD